MMAASTNLVIPVVLWGKTAPTHCISSIYLSRDQKNLVTGCYDGQICLWQVDPETLKMTPRCLLVGHTAPVLCLCKASILVDNNYIVSSSESGEMCTWDLVDGKCREAAKHPYVHTNMQAYHMAGTDDVRLFCNGYYAEVLIMDPFSLELLFTLSSRVNPDWISALHVLRPAKRKDDVVLALTTTGTIKVWTLSSALGAIGSMGEGLSAGKGSSGTASPTHTPSSSLQSPTEPCYENESKQIRCLNALTMTCCSCNQRTVLIVCSKYWQIFDAGDFSVLCSVIAPQSERWMGGDFLSADRVLVWSDEGKGYLYQLPANKLKGKAFSCIADHKDFHTRAVDADNPFLYCILSVPSEKPLSCPPAVEYFFGPARHGKSSKYLLRGDSDGNVILWNVPDVTDGQLAQIRQEEFVKPPGLPPNYTTSLTKAWAEMKPPPVGILDQLDTPEVPGVKLTASIFLPQQGRLVCGREDGSIVIVPAVQSIMLQLLHGRHQQYDDWPPHQLLLGHSGRVNCLLYPHNVHSHYEPSQLVSGGVDFAVCLWDLNTASLLHRFCVHAGEVTQLLVPPSDCSPRIQKCVCSVGSDHSVALLGLTERKCVVLASRHLFPVVTIKWRPLDDFMVVGCSDGTVYVWQMETGHLDRVLHGISAEEVLCACDDNVAGGGSGVSGGSGGLGGGGEMGLANPAVHFFRGLRHRNLSAIRHATQRGLHQLQQLHHDLEGEHGESAEMALLRKSRAFPLMVQGLRTNPRDPEGHVLFFDIEALAVQLLSEEYSTMSPGTLEAQGLINQSVYSKVIALTQSASPEAHKKIADFFGRVKDKAGDMERILKEKDRHGLLAKMKEGAENVQTKLQARAEIAGFRQGPDGSPRKGSDGSGIDGADGSGRKPRSLMLLESNTTMEVAQVLLSLLHAWGMDQDLDRVCESTLGLLRPLLPVSFGLLSKGGYMSLLLPTALSRDPSAPPIGAPGAFDMKASSESKGALKNQGSKQRAWGGMGGRPLEADLPPEMVELERKTRAFTAREHWELSTTMTTNHLLAVVALANTLMSMNNATFVPEQERRRKLHRQSTRVAIGWAETEAEGGESEDAYTARQAQIKQGWSLLATLHCVLLPEKVAAAGSRSFKRPQVEMMARRWQDHCLEVREAAQALLLAELGRMGPKGRKALVDSWAPYLPLYSEAPGQAASSSSTPSSGSASVQGQPGVAPQQQQAPPGEWGGQHHDEEEEEEEEGVEEMLAPDSSPAAYAPRKPSSLAEAKRRQTTAVVLLGVIGAEFGQDMETNKRRSAEEEQRRKRGSLEGFGIGNNNLARLTSLALTHLLLAPPSPRLPAHTPLRRAAIDLIGRGFTVWEPYLDVSKILLALLELCSDSDHLVPSMMYGLPLTPAADSCRTARHALTLIATARPAAFITTMAREVARYNTLQQNAQTLNVNLSNSVLHRAKPEILRGVELLIDKMQSEMADLLIEVVDIVLHCLDPGRLKTRGLAEVFPAICRFNQVSHCPYTRRIAVGAKNGNLAIYELRSSKCQLITAHGTANTALSFSPDGKYLASYACGENKLSFWQTSTGMFGLGNSQTRCVKTYTTTPIAEISSLNPIRLARLVWINNRTVSLLPTDGSETRYNV
ncbi:WD repeat-containing protein 7 isoform X4 [Hetaerina americana]|uniref:WD repeat-containing protein 7 isoform X4 n=1 Tax=Hetaerina americana TaxID=62018 RepID=UPI003A7F48DC